MASDVEIQRVLVAVSATLNGQKLDRFDRGQVQEVVTGALGDRQRLEVDDGGGLHDESGVRVGAIRRLPDGSWHVDRQNYEARNAAAEIPAPSERGVLRRLLAKLHRLGR